MERDETNIQSVNITWRSSNNCPGVSVRIIIIAAGSLPEGVMVIILLSLHQSPDCAVINLTRGRHQACGRVEHAWNEESEGEGNQEG